jgi:hypothetical protein
MVGTHFFYSRINQMANMGRWLSVTTAAATLIGLSALNALHGPAYDCVRAGVYLLRSRRDALVPMIQVEQATHAYGVNVTLTSRLSARP